MYFQVEFKLKVPRFPATCWCRLEMGNIDAKEQDREIVMAQVQVWHEGQLQSYIYPGRTFYRNFGNQPASQISILTFGVTDLYILLDNWDGPSQATLRVFINPLVPLIWYGGLIMLLGGVICWWPGRRRLSARVARSTSTSKTVPSPGVKAEVGEGGVKL